MALPASGTITMSQVDVELGRAANANVALDESAVRTLFGVPSGSIAMSNGYGKANDFAATITTHQKELNLATWAAANGWNGSANAVITIASGVYIWSDNTAVAALTTGNFPNGLTIINNGYIMGRGGNGDGMPNSLTLSHTGAGSGGPAISLGCATIINNTNSAAYIGGGGGGGGGYFGSGAVGYASGGGGAGGGNGGLSFQQSGGSGGAIGASGGDGAMSAPNKSQSGGGGGRIFPGTGGNGGLYISLVVAKGGGSGGGGGSVAAGKTTVFGGSGGSGSGAGLAGGGSGGLGGGGGGWGAVGGPCSDATYGATGGVGGKAVALNGYGITWVSGDTARVYGAVA